LRGERTAARFGGVLAWYVLILLAACAQVETQQAASAPTPARTNAAPLLGGTPATTITVGSAYQFAPAASDSDGDALTFSISNKPAWASYSAATGVLNGTPGTADVGNYPNIVIAVSDGRATVSLQAFSLLVSAAGGVSSSGGGSATATATLAWTVPTENADGSRLTDLAGYWIYYGTSSNSLVRLQGIADPATTHYLVTGLSSGTHFFAVSTLNSANVESRLSAVGTKSVP
jgi:Putative Ig domain